MSKCQARLEDEYVMMRESGLKLLFIEAEVASPFTTIKGLVDTTGLFGAEASL